MIIKKKIKGYWFYGLSGSGKSHLSLILKKKIKKKKTFIIDGDEIRKNISFDLGYSIKERKIQITRVLGISKICIKNNFFPIISTVYMNKKIQQKASSLGIIVVKVLRPNINMKTKIYKLKKNVVGKDLKLPNTKSKILINDGGKIFWKKLIKYSH